MGDNLKDREIIIELHSVGGLIRAAAMDTRSLTEVVIQAPAGTPETIIRQNLAKKLEYVLRKKGLIH